MDSGHPHDCNVYIDEAANAISVPSRDEIVVNDPEFYLNRLNELQSGRERLEELLISVFNPDHMPTHESFYIRSLVLTGAAAGWVYGGIIRNLDLTAEYVRKFNTATFEGRAYARRHYTDYYLSTAAGRGIKHALYGGVLGGAAGIVGFGSITYRNKLYYPDWAIGFTALGSLSRFWSLGLRGAIGGGGFGLIGGTLGFGVAKLVELLSQKSVSEIRYFNHTDYLKKRDANRENYQRVRETLGMEKINK